MGDSQLRKTTASTLQILFLGISAIGLQRCELATGGLAQDGDGNDFSEEQPGSGAPSSPSELRRVAAMQVLQKNCASCHGPGGSAAEFPPFDSADHAWSNSEPQLVVAGEVEKSALLARIKDSNDKEGYRFDWGARRDRDMPQSSKTLSSQEIKTLVAWVEGMSPDDSNDDPISNPPDTQKPNDPLPTTPPPTTTPPTTPPPTTPPPVTIPPNDPNRVTRIDTERFSDAMKVINAKCMGCHQDRNDLPKNGSFNDENAWRNSGYVTPGDNLNSPLVGRLKAASNGGSLPTGNPLKTELTGDMPKTGSLTVSEVAAIVDWIDLMDQPRTQLINLKAGLRKGAWNAKNTPISAKVGDNLRVRNLDTSTHSIHTNNNKPFDHGVNSGNEQKVNFGGVQTFTFTQGANNVSGNDAIYDHFQSAANGLKIYMQISP